MNENINQTLPKSIKWTNALTNIFVTCVYNGCCCIVYEHWPDTCELITRTVELWNRWIKVLSCYYNRV